MPENSEKLKYLLHKLDTMSHQQARFQKELADLRKEILGLQNDGRESGVVESRLEKPVQSIPIDIDEYLSAEPAESLKALETVESEPIERSKTLAETLEIPEIKTDLEKFIGENLINKIGILIIILGVAIGAKYAIDNDMINPATRIIFGYLTGMGLMGFSLKLKAKYESFSAVLLSGGIAILYFITFAAYDFYGLIPRALTFGLMTIFTGFTVVAAIHYSRQVIAIIGLVGAYAVPFLLSSGSGNVAFLLNYVTIVNIGILVVAFWRDWKPLYYLSFVFTWLIFGSWLISRYETAHDFGLAMTFLTIFFLLFYGTFMVYKMVKKEKFEIVHVVLLLLNSVLFYGIGSALLSGHSTGEHLLGVFALVNALIHFGVSAFIYKNDLADKNLFYLIAGMVLVFITIAVPIQLDGNWVTLIWASEAALLFWIGRAKNAPFYEKLSYPVMILGFLSLVEDWSRFEIKQWEEITEYILPVFNIHFLTGILFAGAFTFVLWIHLQHKYEEDASVFKQLFWSFNTLLIAGILGVTLFYTGVLEINNYWTQAYQQSAIAVPGTEFSRFNHNESIFDFRAIWLYNYSIVFFIIGSFINILKLKSKKLGYGNLGINLFLMFLFLTGGLFYLSELREAYLGQYLEGERYQRGMMYLLIRYISLGFFAGLLFATHKYTKAAFLNFDFSKYFEALCYFCGIWVLSSELLHWMDIGDAKNQYKLALSILWGVSALALIGMGIYQRKKFIRIGAMVLFGGTLVKLFFYDIVHLNTISKTIVLVSLGVLLLIISFLYNKFKDEIAEKNEE
ncbi:MAG: putative membrane protein [Paraglaciecola sp.]|jgi:uncharacterized membrane protein